MKNVCLVILLVGGLSQVAHAFDIDRYCRNSMPANTERAAWGLDLRSEMLQNCEGMNLRICSDTYRDQVIRQERFDQITLQEQLKAQTVSNLARYLQEKAVMQKTTAAYMALRGVRDTPEAIADVIYEDCITSMPVDLAAISGEGGSTSLVAPACSNYSGMDAQYRQRCCSPDCYCDVYCQ